MQMSYYKVQVAVRVNVREPFLSSIQPGPWGQPVYKSKKNIKPKI